MIDTHCHLFEEDYDNLDELLKEIFNNNIYCIVNGCDYLTNKEAIQLCCNNGIYASIGYHPTELNKIPENHIKILEEMLLNNKIVAIGEIGLDYHYDYDKEVQKRIFKEQLDLAQKYNLPIIVHSRDAINDVYEMLKNYKLRGIIHAFSGSYEMAVKFIKLGYKLGIGGVITFKNCNLKNVVAKISLDDIVLETDSPYLTPEPNRGKKNSPLNLRYIASYIADIKGTTYEEVCKVTNYNAISLFDLNIKL